VEDRITFVGHTTDVGRYLGVMDAFVSTSPSEPFGIALVEAMALGKPVIAVDAPGPREIVAPERSGLIADPAEPAGLAHAIDRLVADADQRMRLAAGARERYAEAFTPERMCAELTARLEELACG
jgi:glycosyltransferase involved in cell wall biosynthesis